MNDLSHGERAIVPPKDYITTVEATIKVEGRVVDVGFDLYGGYVRGFPEMRDTPAEPGGYAIDRVKWHEHDVTAAIPDELMEIFTTLANGGCP